MLRNDPASGVMRHADGVMKLPLHAPVPTGAICQPRVVAHGRFLAAIASCAPGSRSGRNVLALRQS